MVSVRTAALSPRHPLRHPRTRLRSADPAATTASAPPPHRSVVRPRVLLDVINRDLLTRPECAGIVVDAGRWDISHAAGDCNWSEASLVVRVTGEVSASAFTTLRRVIAWAQLRYDVFAPEAYLG